MIGIDTNILVRYIAQDDAQQSQKATEFIESLTETHLGFIPLVSIIELVWVMQGCYEASKNEMIKILDKILRIPTIQVENADIVFKAVHLWSGTHSDFPDCLIERSANNAGCKYTVTFDRKATKIAGMKILP